MSDEEYDDELPPISVNSSARDSQGLLHMPSAEELASQRAREAECERELQLLRTADNDPVLATNDSSGSEGEAALAAAVTALRVRALSRAQPPALSALLPALLGALPCGPLRERLQRGDDATQVEAQEALVEHMCAMALLEDPPGAAEDAALVGVVLCAGALAARGRAGRRAARRALHVLLEHASFAREDSEVSVAFRAAALAGTAGSQRLELADALAPVLPTSRSAALLHRQLLVATLAELLDVDAAEAQEASSSCACAWSSRAVSARWGRLAAARGGPCVRAAGRVARACPGGPAAAEGPGGPACAAARARLLAALAAQPASARTAPDRLEVLVGASKLQLLFRD